MLQKTSFSLFSIAMTLKWATSMEKIPEMLRAISGFLEKEPDENFSLFDNRIPLSVNEEAMHSFERALSKFPEVIRIGKAQTENRKDSRLNVVITIGQILTHIVITFDLYANPITPALKEKYKGVKSPVDDLHKIWGSYEKMNATTLSVQYSHKGTKETKTSLIKKLNDSADLIEKRILPEIKSKSDHK
jgi:hypothetical protein